jgi:hypothetical protein
LNPANGPSRRPDYKAQAEPSLVQKDLLANKLVESNPDLLETARLNSTKLHNTAIAQEELSLIQKDLCNTVRCQLCIVVRPKLALAKAKPESIFSLLEAERAMDARRSPLVDPRG